MFVYKKQQQWDKRDCLQADHLGMCIFSQAWSLPVMRQRWQLHHTIHHDRKPHAACKLRGSIFYRTRLINDRIFTLWICGILCHFATVILTLNWWPL